MPGFHGWKSQTAEAVLTCAALVALTLGLLSADVAAGVEKAIFAAVEQATPHFWDAYLKGDAQAKAWLRFAKLEPAKLLWR